MRHAVALVAALALGFPWGAASAAETRDLKPSSAAELADEARVALVIGNGDYSVGSLKNPAADARDVAETLSRLGFSVSLLNDVGYREMRRAIADFSRSLKPGGVGLFFYAGHGLQYKGENYLVPVDASIQSELYIKVEAVNVSDVLAGMEDARGRLNIVILDACRSNPFERSFRSTGGGLATIDAPTGTLIAYSTGPGKVAEDGSGKHSTYTSALLRFMGTPGARIEDVFKSVRVQVAESTANQQIPWETSSLVGDFYFAPKPVEEKPPAEEPSAPLSPEPRGLASKPGAALDVKAMAARERLFRSESDKLIRQASKDWSVVKPLLDRKDEGTRRLVETWLAKWGPGRASLTVEGETRQLEIPLCSEVTALLDSWPKGSTTQELGAAGAAVSSSPVPDPLPTPEARVAEVVGVSPEPTSQERSDREEVETSVPTVAPEVVPALATEERTSEKSTSRFHFQVGLGTGYLDVLHLDVGVLPIPRLGVEGYISAVLDVDPALGLRATGYLLGRASQRPPRHSLLISGFGATSLDVPNQMAGADLGYGFLADSGFQARIFGGVVYPSSKMELLPHALLSVGWLF